MNMLSIVGLVSFVKTYIVYVTLAKFFAVAEFDLIRNDCWKVVSQIEGKTTKKQKSNLYR